MLDDTKSRTTFLITTTIKTSLSEEEEEERQSIKKNLKEIKCIRTAPELSFGLEGRAEPASPTNQNRGEKKLLR